MEFRRGGRGSDGASDDELDDGAPDIKDESLTGTGLDPGGAGAEPRYALRTDESGIRWFTARADQPRVTQAFLEAARTLVGQVGVVLVEVTEPPREWMAIDLERASVLEALLGVRDLLGGGLVDVAVFSPGEGIEIFVDRFGTLEIRAGSWNEPRVRGLLETLGFARWDRLSVLPPEVPDPVEWSDDVRARVEAFRCALALSAPDSDSDSDSD